MKILYKALVIGLLFSTFTPAYASTSESTSFLQRVKNFFASSDKKSETKQKPDSWEGQAERAGEETVTTTEQANEDAPTFDFSDKVIGNPDAPIKIMLFTSLTCGHCAGVHLNMVPQLVKTYTDNGDGAIILMDFPLEPRAMTGSLIAHCLNNDKYFAFMDTLFEHQYQWAVAPNLQEALLPYAKLAGISEAKMMACATNEDALKEITRRRNLNIMRYKINATPTFVIRVGKETEKIEGAVSMQKMESIIDKMKESYTGTWPSQQPKPKKTAPSAP